MCSFPVASSSPDGTSSASTRRPEVHRISGSVARLAALAIAEQCIDHELCLAERIELFVDRDRKLAGDRELLGRYGGEALGCRGERDGDLRAGSGQVPCRDQAAAAVSTRPGEHEDRASCRVTAEQLARHLGEAAAGVLHHPHQRDSEFLDHDPVDLAHLLD
jgi:hypothetical protein